LSSRIAYGVQITPAGLGRVDRAEQAVRDVLAADGVDVRDLRVRDLGDDRARVELDTATLERLGADPEVGARVTGAAVAAGFSVAEVDPRGFRSGSMNELLAAPERYR